MSVIVKEPEETARACIIWMHGLGSDARDMEGLAEQLSLAFSVKHVCLNALVRPVTLNNNLPMQAWYDITGLNLNDREDKPGILDSAAIIQKAIDEQIASGFKSTEIFLAGFSQGGAMALFAGLHYEKPLAGLIALSSYIPLASQCIVSQDTKTPVFIAFGQFDDLVLPEWSEHTIGWLHEYGFNKITRHAYPMAHSVCFEEIKDLSQWLNTQIPLISEVRG